MILDGTGLANKIKNEVREEVKTLKSKGITPALRCLVSSNDKSTRVYLNSIKRNCDKLGIDYAELETNSKNIMEDLKSLNEDDKVHGVMLMHPVPKGVNEISLLDMLNPQKDVEGRTPKNLGKILLNIPLLVPCTAQAVVELLEYYNIPLKGADVTIVGRSTTVGKPLSLLLMSRNATITVCHSKTRNLIEKTRRADVVVVAIGKAKMIDKNWIKEGSVVVDVGINVVNGKIVGDVDFDSVSKKASVSKVPGGVGTVTNAILMRNVVRSAKGM